MENSHLLVLPIDSIELDKENPRIKQFLEIYEGEITAEQIALALSSCGGESSTAYRALKESIKVSKGIIHPIVVNKEPDGKYIVIEGNTRLQIYKDFHKSDSDGPWDKIVALVYNGLTQNEKHKIRLQSHLVGPRDWDPYSKAKYLHQLSEVEYIPMATIISMCGGNTSSIQNAIEAYNIMQKSYLPYVNKHGYDPDPREYSKFVEYNKSSIKQAVAISNFNDDDFAKWVAEGNIDVAQKVRIIPRVLKDKDAKTVFLKKNLSEAEKVLAVNEVDSKINLSTVAYEALCQELIKRFEKIELKEIKGLANADTAAYESKYSAMESLSEVLSDIFSDIDLIKNA